MDVKSFETLDANAVEDFRRDGVVCVREAFDPHWIALARQGIQRYLDKPGRFFRDHTPEGSPGRYLFGFWTWQDIPEFREIVFDSPAAELAAKLMSAQSVRMVMDNWFLREAGATNGAPWHHDEPYFDFEGPLCVLWMPLESVSREEGLVFARGSHRWGQLYVASQFSENVPFDASGEQYAPMPDLDTSLAPDDRLGCALEPGDCLVFNFRTLHAATTGHEPLSRTIYRFTLRFAAPGARFSPRGEWTRELSDFLIEQGQRPGAELDCDFLPVAWKA